MKRVFSSLLTLVLCLGLWAPAALAAPALIWYVDPSGALLLSEDGGASYGELPGLGEKAKETGLDFISTTQVTFSPDGGLTVAAKDRWGEEIAFQRTYSADEVSAALARAVPTPVWVVSANDSGALGRRKVTYNKGADLAAGVGSWAITQFQAVTSTDGVTWTVADTAAPGEPEEPFTALLGPYRFTLVRGDEPYYTGYDYDVLLTAADDPTRGLVLPDLGKGIREKHLGPGNIAAWHTPDNTVTVAVYDKWEKEDFAVQVTYPVSSLDWCLENLAKPLEGDQVPAEAPGQAPAKTGFLDVPAGSWFEKGVMTCAQESIMVGTGEGIFSPQAQLTGAECLALALRLYKRQMKGFSGTLQPAPEDWGKITLTNVDGTVYSNHSPEAWQFGQPEGGHNSRQDHDLHVILSTADQQKADPPVGRATLNICGQDFSGTTFIAPDPQRKLLAFKSDAFISASQLGSLLYPLPGQWWRDVFYTTCQMGLDSYPDTPGFSLLLTGRPTESATREDFARALADAAGKLPVLRDEITIPDVTPGFPDDGIYTLYKAGILNGIDAAGTFGYGMTLTRAEAATMVARVLDPTLRIGAATPPAEGPVMTTEELEAAPFPEQPYPSYEEAAACLRSGTGYHNEKTFDTDACTVFCYDLGGSMNAPTGLLRVVCKAGAPYPEGTILTLPHPRSGILDVSVPADAMTLSEDGRTFTYAYTFHEPLYSSYGVPIRGAGTFTYAADLTTGKVTLTAPATPTITYAESLAKVTGAEGFTVEKTLESPICAIVLGYTVDRGMRDYQMTKVYTPGFSNPDHGISEGAILPETLAYTNNYVDDPDTGHVRLCTDRGPDTLVLSKDGSTLFYSYDLGDGPLTQLTGGGVHTSVRDLSSGAATFYDLPGTVEVLSRGCTVEKTLRGQGHTALLVYDQPHRVKDYALYVIDEANHRVFQAILPSTYVGTADGAAYTPTDRGPDSMEVSSDGKTLTYVYTFDKPLLDENGVSLHEAGRYTYTVDLATGKSSCTHQ